MGGRSPKNSTAGRNRQPSAGKKEGSADRLILLLIEPFPNPLQLRKNMRGTGFLGQPSTEFAGSSGSLPPLGPQVPTGGNSPGKTGPIDGSLSAPR